MKVMIDGLEFEIIEEGNQNGHVFVASDETDIQELDTLGAAYYARQKIYIHRRLNVDLKKRTLRHELTHAFLETRGFAQSDMNDEQICEFVASVAPLVEKITDNYFKGKARDE